jgi:hypothetical protein
VGKIGVGVEVGIGDGLGVIVGVNVAVGVNVGNSVLPSLVDRFNPIMTDPVRMRRAINTKMTMRQIAYFFFGV